MPKVITLDNVVVENIQLSRKRFTWDTGEVDEESNPIMDTELRWSLTINHTMSGGGARHGGTKTFVLTQQQRNQVKGFIKPFIVELKTEIDIQDGEDWTDN